MEQGYEMECFSPLKGFRSRETGGIVFRRGSDAGEPMTVACGQCLGCRIDYSQTWAARIVHEAALYDTNCFITLTYNQENLPPGGSLVKSDFQKFMKRLRKKFPKRNIRYYHCGEYGEQLERPHYHACLFNFQFPDQKLLGQNEGNFLFTSETLSQLWPYGFSTIGELTYDSAAYVSRYVLKKVTGHMHDDHYMRCDDYGVAYWLQPEYTTMSRRPGIGKEWYEKYKSDVFPSDELPIPGRGVFKNVPRYYEDLLEKSDPELHQRIKVARAKYAKNRPEEYTPQKLESKYKIKKAQLNLRRQRQFEGYDRNRTAFPTTRRNK